MQKGSPNPVVTLALAAILFMSLAGLPHFGMDMGARADGQMSSHHCFMPGMTASLCHMNPLEHLSAWQSLFTGAPIESSAVWFLLALVTLVFGTLSFHYYARQSAAPPELFALKPSFAYSRRRAPALHPLHEAFSQGILNPKLF